MSVQKGLNSDLSIRGKSYHVQTEDWGVQNPFLVSRIFSNGAVLKTVKTPYADALRAETVHVTQAIASALIKQHQNIVDQLMAGRI